MRDKPIAEKCGRAMLGAIEKLIGHQKLAGPQLFLQRTNRAYGNDPLDPEFLHGVDIRAIIDFARQNAMAASMPSQKRNALSLESTQRNGVRRIAKRRLDAHFARVGDAVHRIESTAADDSDRGLGTTFASLLTLTLASGP